MILKYNSLTEDIIKNNNFFLLYGNNEGLKNNIINKFIRDNQTLRYDENEVLNNQNQFYENAISNSLFETSKTIIIKRASDKILEIIEEVINKNNTDNCIIIDASALEKRSKLRSFFEKKKNIICIAIYPDSEQTLFKLAFDFFKKKNISISPSSINNLVFKCNGDRANLLNELNKIENYSRNGKKINPITIDKLTNIVENYSISELVDNCLIKNQKKIISILNENNFSNEDCIIITRTFLNKTKKILALSSSFQKNNDIDLTISTAKPPIFWKDKEIVKEQIFKWSPKKIRELIYKISELELLLKKNVNNSISLITDFIIFQTSSDTNN